MNVADLLEAGARRLEYYGWMQSNGFYSPHDLAPQCAANAIAILTDDYPEDVIHAQHALAEYLSGSENIRAIWAWNDAPGQTKENVIATMRACAAIWRAKQENTDANDTRPQVCIPERSRDEPAGISGEAFCRDTVSAGD